MSCHYYHYYHHHYIAIVITFCYQSRPARSSFGLSSPPPQRAGLQAAEAESLLLTESRITHAAKDWPWQRVARGWTTASPAGGAVQDRVIVGELEDALSVDVLLWHRGSRRRWPCQFPRRRLAKPDLAHGGEPLGLSRERGREHRQLVLSEDYYTFNYYIIS